MPQTKRLRGSMYGRYFVSYCCIALIPVFVLIAALMLLFQQNYTTRAQELYRRSMVQASSHFDALMQEMQSQASNFSAVDDTEGILQYLAQAENSSRLGAETLFYLSGDTDIYTARGKMPYERFEQDHSGDFDLNYSRFFTHLNATTQVNMIPLYAGVPSQDAFSAYVAALFPYYSQSLKQQGVFAFILPGEALLDVFADYLGATPEYAYLYTPNLELVMAWEQGKQTQEKRTELLRVMTGTIASIQLGERTLDVQHHKSDLYGYQFVLGVSLDKLYMDLSKMQGSTLTLLLLVLVGIFFGAICLARYSYRPIKALLETIDQHQEGEAGVPQAGELDYIGNHITQVHSQVQALHETLARQQPVVRDHLLQRLLRGSMSPDMGEQLAPFLTPQQQKGWGYVALVSGDGESLPGLQQPDLEQIALDGLEGYGLYLEEDQLFAFVLFSDSGEDQRFAQCMELFDLLLIKGAEEIRLSAGSLVQGAEKISESFLEAYIALNDQRLTKGAEKIAIYDQSQSERYSGTRWETQKEMEIYLQSLRSVDEKTAAALFSTLLEHMNALHTSLLNASYIRYDLFSKALNVCEEQVANAFRTDAISIECFSDDQRYRELMLDLTRQNCQRVEEKRGTAMDQRRRRILTLIQEHCFEADFSLSRLSELAAYSPTFINHFLKEETGLSYSQYVSSLRLEKAKYALRSSDAKIKEIVAQCGYVDITSFTRKFKECEGMPPGEYRALARQGKTAPEA